MKKSQFTETQIISILSEADAGFKFPDINVLTHDCLVVSAYGCLLRKAGYLCLYHPTWRSEYSGCEFEAQIGQAPNF